MALAKGPLIGWLQALQTPWRPYSFSPVGWLLGGGGIAVATGGLATGPGPGGGLDGVVEETLMDWVVNLVGWLGGGCGRSELFLTFTSSITTFFIASVGGSGCSTLGVGVPDPT